MTPQIQRKAFIAAVLVQLLILIAVPAQKMKSLYFGRTIFLQVAPVDPYSIMSGYYVTLSYDIQRLDKISSDAARLDQEHFRDVYVTVEEHKNGLWEAVSAEGYPPGKLSENQVFLHGNFRQWRRVTFGIEDFYIPEGRRKEINDDLQKNRDKARVEVKVDDAGNAVLVSLRIEDRVYR
ncbi:MAG: GDYXXLXY domain-containing protein [Candidatus Riflebacteria bacterium]|nr:GDYXXLXY domain-containing protein [Candidatus Riflebacteria bacterium]